MTWICATCGLSVENAAPFVFTEGRARHLSCANAGYLNSYAAAVADVVAYLQTAGYVEVAGEIERGEAKGCAK